MLKLVKTEGTQWYVKLFIESDIPVMEIDTECSDNVQFDSKTGATLDGTWSEFTIDQKTLHFKRKGTAISLAANISDGSKFSVIGVDVIPSKIENAELKPRSDTPPRPPISDTVKVMAEHPVEKWFTSKMWDELFPHANGAAFLNSTPYSHEEFVKSIRHFPEFASGSIVEQKKECAALFGMALQEVGGKSLIDGGDISIPGLTKTQKKGFSEPTWDTTPSHKWNLYKSCEDDSGRSTTYDTGYPGLKPNQKYFAGSGILQLSYPANYARFSEFYFGDREVLLNNSDLVRTDGDLAIGSGIFYWMSPADARPSPHCCLTGKPVSKMDAESFNRISKKGYRQGFAMAICAVNGIECAIRADYRVGTRVNGYFQYGKAFGLTQEQLLEDCYLETADMPPNLNDV